MANVLVVIEGGVGAGAIVIRNARVALRVFAPVTRAVKSKFPAAAGMPEIVPFAFMVTPPGNAPADTDHAYGVVPPVAARVAV